MSNLCDLKCQSLPTGTNALASSEIDTFLGQLSGWKISTQNKLTKIFNFNNYYETIAFVNAIAWIANQEDHHPDLIVTYNTCTIAYDTHTVKGLSKNDFICAAKIDKLVG